MAEQSQKEEMNAAIRAHRERQNVPRSIAPEPLPPRLQPEPEHAPEKPKGLLSRLFAK
jgi:hypothetical protein